MSLILNLVHLGSSDHLQPLYLVAVDSLYWVYTNAVTQGLTQSTRQNDN